MTMRARGTNAARTNAGVYSGEHGQRRLLLWSAAARAGRCWLPAALVRGSRCAGVPCLVYFLFLSRSGARDSFGAWSRSVSRRWPRGRRYRRREREEGCLLEKGRRKGGSWRARWTGTIWVTRGRVGAERGRDPGESGRQREWGIERARALAWETHGG